MGHDVLFIDEQGAGQSGHFHQAMPFAILPGQPRDFQAKNSPGLSKDHRGQQALKAGAEVVGISR